MITYFTQVCSGILLVWILYRTVLINNVAPKMNRAVLLMGLIFPFFVPLIQLNEEIISVAQPLLLSTVFSENSTLTSVKATNTTNWISIIYIVGVGFAFVKQLGGLFSFIKIKQKAVADEKSGIYYIKEGMPFSFFKAIFLPFHLAKMHKSIVINHEKWHIKLGHRFDLMVTILAQSILWFFPIIPFYIKDLRTEHEYEVDEKMLMQVGFSAYADSLLHLSLMPVMHKQFHSFTSTSLKKRIIMMNKTQQKSKWRLLFLIPLIGSMIYINALSAQSETSETKKGAVTFAELDQIPLFNNCDKNASKTEQYECFREGIQNHIVANFKYPEIAKKTNTEGKVSVQFVIDNKGKVKNVTVVRNINKTAENEIAVEEIKQTSIDMFLKMPTFLPAVKNGKKVATEYVVPINYKLN